MKKKIIYTLRADFSTAQESEEFRDKKKAIREWCKKKGKSVVYVDMHGKKDKLWIVPGEVIVERKANVTSGKSKSMTIPYYNNQWSKKFKPKKC